MIQPTSTEFGWKSVDVGWIMTAYLGFYALGQFMWGAIGDVVGARKVVIFGVCLSLFCNFAFGFTASVFAMTVLWGLNGLAQSSGWPSVMKTMSAWFGLKERGRVMA